MENSQIMRTLHILTDLYGPRLTGSPNHKAAADWAVKQMKDWKFDNAISNRGISVIRAGSTNALRVLSPRRFRIRCVLRFSRGHQARKRSQRQTFQLIVPTNRQKPKSISSDASRIDRLFRKRSNANQRQDGFVGKPAVIPVNFDPQPKRIHDEILKSD